MEKYNLSAKPRETVGKKVKGLREGGEVPAVVYGFGQKPQNVAVDEEILTDIYKKAGSSALVDLAIGENKPIAVIIQELQKHAVTGKPLHADFYAVRMDKEIHTEIPLEFMGEAPAVKDLDGILETPKDTVEVECLPKDLVAKIEVDISSLKTFDDSIHIRDIAVPPGIKILDDGEETVALVNPPRSEEELKELEEKPVEEEKEALEKMEAETEAEKTAETGETAAGEKKETAEKESQE